MGRPQPAPNPNSGRRNPVLDKFTQFIAPWLAPRAGWLLPVLSFIVYLLVAFQSVMEAKGIGEPLNGPFLLFNFVTKPIVAMWLGATLVLLVVGMSIQWQWEDHQRNLQLQTRFENLVKSAPDAILAVNTQGICLFANGALVQMLGLELDKLRGDEITGQPLSKLIGLPAAEALAAVSANLRPDRPLHNLELEVETAAGKVPVLASLAQTGQGETTLQLKNMQEFEQTQALLRLFHNAFMHSSEAVIITDEQVRILEVNETFTQLYGYTRDMAVGHNPRLLRSPKTPPETFEQMWASIKQRGFWTGRLINQAHDGTEVPVMLSVTALTDETGQLIGYLGFAVNLTHQLLLEQEVQEAQMRYQNLVENSTDLIFTMDTDLKFTFANSQFEEQMGYDPEALLGTDAMALVVEEQREWLTQAINYGLEHPDDEGLMLELEFSVVAADGSLRHYAAAGAFMRDEEGAVVGVGAIARNVTREKELTERLAESEARHRELLEHMQEMVFQVDSLGQLTYVNPAFVDFFGFESAEATLGTSLVNLHRDAGDWEALVQLLHEKELVQDHQMALLTLEGRPVEVSNHARVILDDQGGFIGIEGSMRDVTEKVALERRARELALFTQLNPAPVFRLNRQGRVELANPVARKLLGAEVVGRKWVELFPDSPDPELLLKQESGLVAWEAPVGDHHYHFTLQPKAEEGQVYIYGLDLTERKNLEREREKLLKEVQRTNAELEEEVSKRTERLVQSEKMAALGQLVAGVAHEINNPLSFLKANLTNFTEYFDELIGLKEAAAKADLPPEVAKELEYYGKVIEHGRKESAACQTGVERIASITRSLRLFAHPKEEKLAPSDLNEGLKHTMVLLRPGLQDVEVSLELKPLPPVVCNPGQINQVMMNLLTNAIQALEGKGHLTVRTWHEGERVYLEVEDDGPGIAAKDLKHIFEPFFTTKDDGTGLGLAISYRLVQEHEGELEVDTEVGRGTIMRLVLPVEGPQSEPADQSKD